MTFLVGLALGLALGFVGALASFLWWLALLMLVLVALVCA